MVFLTKLFQKINNRYLRWAVISGLAAGALGLLLAAGLFCTVFILGPPPLANEENTVYYSENSEVIGEEHGIESRYWVELDEMSPYIIKAALTTEDKRFYSHYGFDLKRIASAVLEDLKAMSKVEGASTITQQYARNLYLSHEKTWTRKLKEAFYALRLEIYYSKDEILEGYLNTIYYGHGAYGVEAASRHFFDKPAQNLTLAESAMLAGIPKGPSYYSPFHHMENAKNRQHQILSSLAKAGEVTEKEMFLAEREPLQLKETKLEEEEKVAPYFQDTVLAELQTILDEDIEKIRSGGYQVYTTLNLDNQKELEEAIAQKMDSENNMQIGAVAMNPNTGAIVSMVGGRDYKESQFNRVTQAERMPGSAFKPFLYYAALENGYTATTALMSKPTSFELEDGTVYQPSNFNGYYANKPITLAQALALSDNVYAVKTNLFLGPEQLVQTAKRFGLDGDFKANPSLALGTGTVTVKDMATAYSILANGGNKVDAYTIEKITDAKGKVLFDRKESRQKERILDEKNAFILTDLMTGMFDESLNGYMSVTGAAISDTLSRPYAGKSGTTNTDSWMVGFSTDIVASVWTGYDKNTPLKTGQETQTAKQVWGSFMEAAHQDLPFDTFEVPEGVIGAYVDPATGDLATPYCESERLMYFVKGTEPQSYCSLHKYEVPDELPSDQEEKQEEKGGWKRWFKWLSFNWFG
ncbi:transglycosylase domain-containing protein [Sediminibacillus massiliensis]|uniref:transglycosylase domain-containing protein n=1 Tax=Sediminibacillus massiliensis TaxID=1926277 RepID=UPI0009887442|nr:PBP1A family penicillin-binding protein [Sediminibacillus massiliensis]